jgi:hypothetical protein
MELKVTDRYYEHIPETVINVSGTTVMRDVPVTTDRTILANRHDTVLREDLPADSNGNTEETEKRSKYTEPEIEVTRMWKVGTKILPVVIGALGTIKKGIDQIPSVAFRSPTG